jgi:transcriptional regulator with XRE-family HTH domain
MEHYEDIYSFSDREIVRDLGEKIRRIRLNRNISREELQRVTGIHVRTIGDAENGKNVTIMNLLGILRGLNSLRLLVPLLTDEEISPVAIAKNREKVRERATGRRRQNE